MNFDFCKNIIILVKDEEKSDKGFILKSNKISKTYQGASLNFFGNSIVITYNKDGSTFGEIFPIETVESFKIEK